MNARIALQNKSSQTISSEELAKVACSLQNQVDQDFSGIWGALAQVFSVHQDDPIPDDAWPIFIVDELVEGLGIHLDLDNKPFARIQYGPNWSISASHELLEMLVDPYGKSFIQAPDIDPSTDGHLVSYLVEVVDPCEVHSYTIDNVGVSDFVGIDYYNIKPVANATFDYLGQLSNSFEVPAGCYISWQDPIDQRWHQKTPDGNFVRSLSTINPTANPRADRDSSFGEVEEKARHDLPSLLKDYQSKWKYHWF